MELRWVGDILEGRGLLVGRVCLSLSFRSAEDEDDDEVEEVWVFWWDPWTIEEGFVGLTRPGWELAFDFGGK